MTSAPLKGAQDSQWPFAGQPTHEPESALFPTADVQQQRSWNKCISRKGFHQRLRRAAEILRLERAAARADDGQVGCGSHPFEGYDLSKLGTHSCKRTAVFNAERRVQVLSSRGSYSWNKRCHH